MGPNGLESYQIREEPYYVRHGSEVAVFEAA